MSSPNDPVRIAGQTDRDDDVGGPWLNARAISHALLFAAGGCRIHSFLCPVAALALIFYRFLRPAAGNYQFSFRRSVTPSTSTITSIKFMVQGRCRRVVCHSDGQAEVAYFTGSGNRGPMFSLFAFAAFGVTQRRSIPASGVGGSGVCCDCVCHWSRRLLLLIAMWRYSPESTDCRQEVFPGKTYVDWH